MEFTRREFFGVTGLTGLAAIADTVSAVEDNENGFNDLIPKYGDSNFSGGNTGEFNMYGIPQYTSRFIINPTLAVVETYLGKHRYAISVVSSSGSFHLIDDRGDGIFRKKYNAGEPAPVPQWVKDKYTPKAAPKPPREKPQQRSFS